MPPSPFFLLSALLASLPVIASAAGCDAGPSDQRDQCLALTAQYNPDCAAIGRATHRLTCWDRLHRLVNCPSADGPVEHTRCTVARPVHPIGVEQTAYAPNGDWTVLQEDSAFSATTNVFLSVPSTRPLTCGRRQRASLILRCLQDQTALYIVHDCATPRIADEGWAADLQLDDDALQRVRMTPTQMGDGFGHFAYRDARPLIERLEAAQILHLRFADIEGISTEMQFPLSGLTRDVGTLKTACGWSEVPPWAKNTAPEQSAGSGTEG